MRSYEEYHKILTLWEKYGNKKHISRLTGINRATIRDCINKFGSVEGLENSELHKTTIEGNPFILRQLKKADKMADSLRETYSYLLGLYLGDGDISKSPGHRVYRLRVALDKKYPDIIQHCVDALNLLFPDNQIGIVDSIGCVYVSLYHKHLPQIFPQHGKGKKHERKIRLAKWQQDIVNQYSLEFFRGLYHSDGSRSRNVVNGKTIRAICLAITVMTFGNCSLIQQKNSA